MGCVCNYKQKSDEEITELNFHEKSIKNNSNNFELAKCAHIDGIKNTSFDEKMNTLDTKTPPSGKLSSPEIHEQILFSVEDDNSPKEQIIEKLEVDLSSKDTTEEVSTCKLSAKKSNTAINLEGNNHLSRIEEDYNENSTYIKKSNTNLIIPSINVSYSTEQNINDNDVFYVKKSELKITRSNNRVNTTKLTLTNNFLKNTLINYKFENTFNKKLNELGNIDELIENLDKDNKLKKKLMSEKNIQTLIK